MTRIARRFAQLKKARKKALILYMTAGDPGFKKNEELALAFDREGVDFLEFGVPFSDPLADGPVIQQASQRALKKGSNVKKILQLVKKVRQNSQIPILLMSYLNPLLHGGIQRFASRARKAGVDGVIIPDLPPDEASDVAPLFKKEGIDLVFLLAPTSGPDRRKLVANRTRGFIYYVSLTGVTGARRALPGDLRGNLKAVKRVSKWPVCVGFGVSTPAQAKEVAGLGDGVIIGSALVRAIASHPHMPAERFAKKFVRPFVRAVKSV